MEKFPGNISDFSDAEKGGFELALKKVFSIKHGDDIDTEVFDEEGSAIAMMVGSYHLSHYHVRLQVLNPPWKWKQCMIWQLKLVTALHIGPTMLSWVINIMKERLPW